MQQERNWWTREYMENGLSTEIKWSKFEKDQKIFTRDIKQIKCFVIIAQSLNFRKYYS